MSTYVSAVCTYISAMSMYVSAVCTYISAMSMYVSAVCTPVGAVCTTMHVCARMSGVHSRWSDKTAARLNVAFRRSR